MAPASGGASSDWSAAVPPTSLLFMALSDSEKENFCPKVFPLKTDLGGIAGVSLILLMPPGDLGREIMYVLLFVALLQDLPIQKLLSGLRIAQ